MFESWLDFGFERDCSLALIGILLGSELIRFEETVSSIGFERSPMVGRKTGPGLWMIFGF